MSAFLTFLICIGGVLGFFGLAAVVSQILDLGYTHDSDVPNITFKHFLDYYNLFPDRWHYGITNLIRYKDSDGTEHMLQFKLFDFIRFKHFLTLKKREMYHMECRNNEVAFLESIQKDIKTKRKEIELNNYKSYCSALNVVNDLAELSRRASCSYKDLSVPRTTDIIHRNRPLTEAEIEYAWTKHITASSRGKLSTYCGTFIPSTINSYEEFYDCIKTIEKGINYEQEPSFIKQIEIGVYNDEQG